MKILDRRFKYTPSHSTNIRARFERERRRIKDEQEASDKRKAEIEAEQARILRTLPRRSA